MSRDADAQPDQISYVYFAAPAACNTHFNVGMFPWKNGNIQVK